MLTLHPTKTMLCRGMDYSHPAFESQELPGLTARTLSQTDRIVPMAHLCLAVSPDLPWVIHQGNPARGKGCSVCSLNSRSSQLQKERTQIPELLQQQYDPAPMNKKFCGVEGSEFIRWICLSGQSSNYMLLYAINGFKYVFRHMWSYMCTCMHVHIRHTSVHRHLISSTKPLECSTKLLWCLVFLATKASSYPQASVGKPAWTIAVMWQLL